MIHTENYTTALNQILKAKQVGRYSIRKTTFLKGSHHRTYHPSGVFCWDELADDFPCVMLYEDEECWMADTPLEQESFRIPALLARGRVLVIGLGLGLFPVMLRDNSFVDTITIVEKTKEVAKLVYESIKTTKTSLEVCDGETYLKNTSNTFDFIFIDVWGTIVDVLKEVNHWTNLANKRLRPGGRVYCWLQEFYDKIKDMLSKGPMVKTGFTYPPCLMCEKTERDDYAGLCLDCASIITASELHADR